MLTKMWLKANTATTKWNRNSSVILALSILYELGPFIIKCISELQVLHDSVWGCLVIYLKERKFSYTLSATFNQNVGERRWDSMASSGGKGWWNGRFDLISSPLESPPARMVSRTAATDNRNYCKFPKSHRKEISQTRWLELSLMEEGSRMWVW